MIVVDAAGDVIFTAAPEPLAAWIAERFGRLLDAVASALAGRPLVVRVFAETEAIADGARRLDDLVDDEDAPPPTRRPDGGAAETVDAPPEGAARP